ncbi:gluconokinase [Sphingomonas sp.]|uniref:gluconokinase n=1 Tax=Sphingomonas sp. TaxID=28214 RepID=UPI002DD646B3|nr:gluconokinase, GntK/IdnK-type [Sphingomonas sp.]
MIGPAGNGKSTLAELIANRMNWRFVEGDEHHPPANIAKMARGEPLSDEDRMPFLESVARTLSASSGGAVAACSALKREYRDVLRRHAGDLVLILAEVGREELHRRMSQRDTHFMPASLLDSQLAEFEIPDDDESCIRIDGTLPLNQQADLVIQRLTVGQE